MTWKSANKWKPSKRQHYWERPEYWEESWRLEETSCRLNSSERPSANPDVKNCQGVNNNNYNNNKGVGNRMDCLQLHFSQGNQYSKNTVSMTFLLTTESETFSLQESQCVSTPMTVFLTQAHCSHLMISPFVKIFWLLRTHYTFFCKHNLHISPFCSSLAHV